MSSTIISTFILISCIGMASKARGQKADDISRIMDNIFQNYDSRVRPAFGDQAINVTLSAHILDLYNIDEENHEFTFNIYLRHHWRDSRLQYDLPIGMSDLMLDNAHATKLWTPDTFIINERKSRVHDLTLRNEFTRISPDGTVLRSTRFTVTASCKMDLKWFPFDRHTCSLQIESYANTVKEFALLWKRDSYGDFKGAVSVSEEVSSITFKTRGVNIREAAMTFSNKTYSRLSMEFFLVRASTRFLQEAYFPAIVLTIISFLTLHSGGSHEFKIQLSSLCLIGMIIFMSLTAKEMPKVTYQTALDFYLFNSVALILNVVLVHFGLFHFQKPSGSQGIRIRYVQQGTSMEDGKETLYEDTQSDYIPEGRPPLSSKFETIIYKGCSTSKTVLPIVFVVFNVLYWIVVLIGSSGYPDDFLILEDHN